VDEKRLMGEYRKLETNSSRPVNPQQDIDGQ